MTFPPSGRISAKCPGKRMPDSNATIKLTTRASPQQGMPLCAGETDRNEHSAGRRSRNQRHQVAQLMLSERVSRHSSHSFNVTPRPERSFSIVAQPTFSSAVRTCRAGQGAASGTASSISAASGQLRPEAANRARFVAPNAGQGEVPAFSSHSPWAASSAPFNSPRTALKSAMRNGNLYQSKAGQTEGSLSW